MPALDNFRQEKFCQLIVKDNLPATRAYIEAGYSERGANRNASRMMLKDDIQARIKELRDKMLVTVEFSVDSWRKDVMKHRQMCLDAKQYGVVAKYDEMIAKHVGSYEADNRQKSATINIGIAVNVDDKDAAATYAEILNNK